MLRSAALIVLSAALAGCASMRDCSASAEPIQLDPQSAGGRFKPYIGMVIGAWVYVTCPF